MDIDREALLQTFLAETEDHLSTVEEALVGLESHPDRVEPLQTVFRLVHSLKGDSLCLGFQVLTRAAHVLEDLLECLLDARIPVTSAVVTELLRSVDTLRRLVSRAAVGNDEPSPEHLAMLQRLEALKEAAGAHRSKEAVTQPRAAAWLQTRATTPPPEPPEGPEPQPLAEMPKAPAQAAAQEHPADLAEAPAQSAHTLRVDTQKLDRMLNLIGEIVVSRGRVTQMLRALDAKTAGGILEEDEAVDTLFAALQEIILKVRMVSIGPMFRQHIRTVRDLAAAQGKQAQLLVEGADVELDTTIIAHLRDPLTHMIRNSMDHGIEAPEVRAAAGKNPTGTIRLSAAHGAGGIVIRLSDDGAGLSRHRIARRAAALGLMPQTMTERELLQLVFQAGFTTAESVTNISGRGVGMDVVRRNVEAVRGSVTLDSTEGAGTTITIWVPLTLSIIDGFFVGAGSETFVVALDHVVECLQMPKEENLRQCGDGILDLRGEALPYVRLRTLFGLDDKVPERENIVVVQHPLGRAGLVVDALYGQRQTVIKPLGKLLQRVPGFLGSAILGTGRVGLILDIGAILKRASRAQGTEACTWLAPGSEQSSSNSSETVTTRLSV